jgi:hypothetical protein
MTGKTLTSGIVILVAFVVIVGCGDDSPTGSVSGTSLVRTSPADAATAVDVDAPIHMMFNEPVDTAQLHEWFFCVDGEMHDAWMDSLTHGMMGMGVFSCRILISCTTRITYCTLEMRCETMTGDVCDTWAGTFPPI